MTINEFGQRSFVTWTTGLKERLAEKEIQMSDKDYLCLSDDQLFTKDELHCCPHCGKFSCPTCGGEVSTEEEYEKAMKANAKEKE